MTEKKHTPKSTVRGRKRDPRASVQRYLPIAEIRNDTLLLKNGGMRAVIEVEALNFNLKSETEQQGIIAGYGGFVNTLTFPLQIVMRSTKTNIDDYLAQVAAIGERHENPLLKEQTLSYVSFIRRLIEVADIMQKKFYVVVPLDRSVRRKTVFDQLFEWIRPDDTPAKASQRSKDFTQSARQLSERVELVHSGLSNIGLHVRRLNTQELITLYYKIFNPKTSQIQKLPGDMNALNIDPLTM